MSKRPRARTFLNASTVARYLGVRPSAVSNWAKRGTGPLPAPAVFAGNVRGWRAADVRAAVETRYAETIALAEHLRQSLETLSTLED